MPPILLAEIKRKIFHLFILSIPLLFYCGGKKILILFFAVSGLVLAIAAVATGGTHIQWSGKFILAFIWLIAVLSVGAILLLLWLLNQGSAASVSSLFYLIPPATALEAFFLFGEKVNTQGFLGIGITALGVWLVIAN